MAISAPGVNASTPGPPISNGGGTHGKTGTCTGSQRLCGPGGRFHAACDEEHGGYWGTNPDPTYGIPQTWTCTLP
jgi:hypothetical protein